MDVEIKVIKDWSQLTQISIFKAEDLSFYVPSLSIESNSVDKEIPY